MSVDVKTREQLREETLAKIPEFKLMDDTYMTAFFNDRLDLIQFVLRIIMGNNKLVVKSVKTQKVLKNIQGRSITLDVYAVDENGTLMNIEVQQDSSGAKPKRARYHSSLIDSNSLLPGDDYEKLPETYVIFITVHDYWRKGLPIYTINRHIEELDMIPFGDEEHIIYVNGENADDTPLGKLMHDFKCTRPKDMYYPNLAERAHYLKETEGGRDSMCKIMDEISNERERQKAIQIAINLLKMEIASEEKIAQATGLSIDEINALSAMLKAPA